MEKETSSETIIKLSSIKEMVNKSSTNVVQTSVSSSQRNDQLGGGLSSMKLMEGETSADIVSSTLHELPNASSLANKISMFKIDDSIDDGLNEKDEFKMLHGVEKLSSMSSTSSSSTVVDAQSMNSSVVEPCATAQLAEKENPEGTERLEPAVEQVVVNEETKETIEIVEQDNHGPAKTEEETKSEVQEDEIEVEVVEEEVEVEETDSDSGDDLEVIITNTNDVKDTKPNETKADIAESAKLHGEESTAEKETKIVKIATSDSSSTVTTDKNDNDNGQEEREEDSVVAVKCEQEQESAKNNNDINEIKLEDGGEEIEVSSAKNSIQDEPTQKDATDGETKNQPTSTETTAPDPKPENIVVESVKHENINNTLREIISDIDINIKEDEAILNLRNQEKELLRKQEELAKQIAEQQKLAETLAAANQLRLEELNKKNLEIQQQTIQQQLIQQQEYARNDNTKPIEQSSYTTQRNIYESNEIHGSKKPIDLNKIFTPATDTIETCPKNRKLYASSAFYSPSLHPTVEDQVELARRISHSLSDISNQTSKGQSMYDNRKKRSVKWIHESTAQGTTKEIDYKENEESQTDSTNRSHFEKIPLRLVMNPRGQVIDFNSVQESINTKTGLLSPDKCAELVNALQTQKDKGAELFAKRRKKADKWIVDETNAGTQSPSGIPDHNQLAAQRPPTSPSILPAYSEAGKHRVQLNMHQEQLLEKYAQPSLTVVKTPWEAALETGSASTAFQEDKTVNSYLKAASPSPQTYAPEYIDNKISQYEQAPKPRFEGNTYSSNILDSNKVSLSTNPQRDLAYKPSIPQGWNAPTVTLPKHMYVPKEIPLENYAPPPSAAMNPGMPHFESRQFGPAKNSSYFPTQKSQQNNLPTATPSIEYPPTTTPRFSLKPTNTWQDDSQNSVKTIPQVNFNPSPLPYEKISKFENKSEQFIGTPYNNNYNSGRVFNSSPTPFGNSSMGHNQIGRNMSPSFKKSYEIQQPFGQQYKSSQNSTSFNNSARGWGCASQNKCSFPMTSGSYNPNTAYASHMGETTGLPFTDF